MMIEANRRQPYTSSGERSLLWLSVGVIILLGLETFVVGFLEADPGYNRLEHPASLLTLANPRLGTIHRLSLTILAAGVLGYVCMAAQRPARDELRKRLIAGFLLLYTGGCAAEEIFPWNHEAPASLRGLLHRSPGIVGVRSKIPISFLASLLARESTVSPLGWRELPGASASVSWLCL